MSKSHQDKVDSTAGLLARNKVPNPNEVAEALHNLPPLDRTTVGGSLVGETAGALVEKGFERLRHEEEPSQASPKASKK